MDFATTFRRQRPALIFAEGLVLVFVIGAFDLMAGYEISLSIIYALPIFGVAWYANRKLGVLTALLAGLVWWWASVSGRLHILNTWQEGWEVLARLGLFVFIPIGAAALRRERDATAARIALLEQSKRMEAEIIQMSEREQRRIGRDLHDGLCQYQAAMACAATSLQDDLLKKGLPEEGKRAGDLAGFLREAIGQTRDLARGLAPVPMEDMGLPSALEELARSVSRLHGISCCFEMNDGLSRFDNSAATHLYRIAQEAIANATRHGQAQHIAVALMRKGDETWLRISDDGAGLSRTTPTGTGMGLSIMTYRAEMAGGKLLLEEPAEGGTTISCVIPWQEEAWHERAA